MSGILSFLGGAATTGLNIIQAEQDAMRKSQEEERLMKLRSSLDTEKERVLDELRTKRKIDEENRARDQAKQAGQDIATGANDLQAGRAVDELSKRNAPIQAAKDAAGPQGEISYQQEPLTPEQMQVIAASKAGRENNGIINSRVQNLDDMAITAENKGLTPQAKEIRGQQDLELRRQTEADRDATANKRWDQQSADNNKRLDQQFEWQKTQAGIANRRADFAEANAKRRDEYQITRDDRADEAGKRQAAAVALKDVAAQSKEISVALAGGMLTPEATKIYEAQKHTLDAERLRYQKQLGEMVGLKEDEKPVIDTLFPVKKKQEINAVPTANKETTPEPKKTQPVIDKAQVKAKRIAEIEAILDADKNNKFDLGKPAFDYIRNRLGTGEKYTLENELAQLKR
jgi:hypothetical protein